jgi:hypothetical protein
MLKQIEISTLIICITVMVMFMQMVSCVKEDQKDYYEAVKEIKKAIPMHSYIPAERSAKLREVSNENK